MAKITNRQVALKPQDIMVVLALLCRQSNAIAAELNPKQEIGNLYGDLSQLTGLAPSAVHSAMKRAVQSRLVIFVNKYPTVIKSALQEFMIHGAKYAFPPVWGAITRGLPTGYAAAPLNAQIAPSSDPPPVWPYAQGTVRGMALCPLYPSVPAAALAHPQLYALLALLDALRTGQARERELARQHLTQHLA